jgi:hypothetical protein
VTSTQRFFESGPAKNSITSAGSEVPEETRTWSDAVQDSAKESAKNLPASSIAIRAIMSMCTTARMFPEVLAELTFGPYARWLHGVAIDQSFGWDAPGTEPREQKSDALYVIESQCGWVKIGRSENPRSRFGAIRTSAPPSVVLRLAIVEPKLGPYEFAVHQALREFRSHGEWFGVGCLDKIAAYGSLRQFVQRLIDEGAKPGTHRVTGARRAM